MTCAAGMASPAEITTLAGTLRDMGNLEEGLALRKMARAALRQYWPLGLACDFLRRLDRPQEERAMTLEILRRFPPEKSVKSCGLNLVRIHERIHGQLPAIESPDIQAIIARILQWAKKTRPIIRYLVVPGRDCEKLNRSGDALAAMDAIERRFPGQSGRYTKKRANILSKMNRATAALNTGARPWRSGPNSSWATPRPAGRAGENGDFSEFDQLMARIKHLLGHKRYAIYRNLFFNLNCHPTYSGGQIWNIPRLRTKRGQAGPAGAKKPLNVGQGPRKIGLAMSPRIQTTFHGLLHGADFQGPAELREFRDNFEVFAYAHFDPARRTSTANVQESRRSLGGDFVHGLTTSWSAKISR